MSDKSKEVEAMISKVMRKKDLSRNQALDYMLGVATGRLSALWRYDASVPEGKPNKGVMISGKKKRAEKAKRISILPSADAAAEKPAKKKPAKKKSAASAPKKKRPKKAADDSQQMIVEGAAE